jgi:hypothetical protein
VSWRVPTRELNTSEGKAESDGLKELIRGKSATSLNTGEHVTSSRGVYYSNRKKSLQGHHHFFAINQVKAEMIS